ncbi:hypothetical protein MHU86_10158 [Fragilaria crotonensis]|nr:hypothetical protein MHU86_10158 [Fragilaria crotonensis]
MLLLRTTAVWALAAMATSVAAEENRQLSEYKYIDDLSGYYASYKTCFRVKINNNDDDAEGESYFYNGKYYAKYKKYVAFDLCSSCGSGCDESTGYVTSLDKYVEAMADYVKDYCEECSQCRRRLEDAEEDAVTVDCSTCTSKCSLYASSSEGGYDEANYLECQAGYNDGNKQYYQAPTCTDGKIVMGLFYDNECTVKTDQKPEMQFDYHTFKTIEKMCVACASGDEVCLYDDSTHCHGSTAMKGDQGNDVCSKYSEAVRTVTYSARKKQWNVFPGIMICLAVVGLGCFLAHTYYIRHRDKKAVPLANLDHGAENESSLPTLS